MDGTKIRAYLVDDEPLATTRLERLLREREQVVVSGIANDPAVALRFLQSEEGRQIDALFLDIQMPEMTGFELLARLVAQPLVIFTTAYDEYALRAFEVNSIDYLLKPIEPEQLDRALAKLRRTLPRGTPNWQSDPQLPALLQSLANSIGARQEAYPRRIASRLGERVFFLNVEEISHFVARDKLTYAVANGHEYCVDGSIADLERRLDPAIFSRVHRAALVNLDCVHELNSWFAGKVVVTLKNAQRTQLTVARDRVRELKSRLGA